MKTQHMRSIAATLALALPSPAFAEIQIIEESVETTADRVLLPSEPPSSVVVTLCRGCTPLRVLTTVRSQYFIGKERVELAELRRQLEKQPQAFVHVVYDLKTKELRRLEAYLRQGAPGP